MAVETKATREAVFAAAQQIVAEGGSPSCSKIRTRVGGSYTTVVRHFRDWRATLSQLPTESAVVPDRITAAIHKCACALWHEINEETNSRLMQEQETMRIQATESDLHLSDSLQEIRRLEDQLSLAEQDATDLKSALERANELRHRAEAIADQAINDVATARASERAALEEAAELRASRKAPRAAKRRASATVSKSSQPDHRPD